MPLYSLYSGTGVIFARWRGFLVVGNEAEGVVKEML